MYIYTVTELANRCHTTPHAVRYYTRMGLLRPERNPDIVCAPDSDQKTLVNNLNH